MEAPRSVVARSEAQAAGVVARGLETPLGIES
jgi:hypothetical protein